VPVDAHPAPELLGKAGPRIHVEVLRERAGEVPAELHLRPAPHEDHVALGQPHVLVGRRRLEVEPVAAADDAVGHAAAGELLEQQLGRVVDDVRGRGRVAVLRPRAPDRRLLKADEVWHAQPDLRRERLGAVREVVAQHGLEAL
jgi:hypothetical protein